MQYISRPIYEHAVRQWYTVPDSDVLCVHGAPRVGKTSVVRQVLTNLPGVAFYEAMRAGCLLDVFGQAPEGPVPDIVVIDDVAPGRIVMVWELVRALKDRHPSMRFVIVGSALMRHINEQSAATLRVRSLPIHPLGFLEYLHFLGRDKLADYLEQNVDVAPSAGMHRLLMREWQAFVAVGGLPEFVLGYRNDQNVEELQRHYVKSLLTDALRQMRRKASTDHLVQALDAVVEQAGEKFFLSRAVKGYRAFQAKKVLDVLEDLGIVLRCTHTDVKGDDLSATTNEKFLRYAFFDTGVLRAWCGGRVHLADQPLRAPSVHRYVDAFVARELAIVQEGKLYWWRREKTGSDAAVEFVTATRPPLPITLHQNKPMALQALRLMQQDKDLGRAVLLDRVSGGGYEDLTVLPVYRVGPYIAAKIAQSSIF